jgi:hypothetical protein
VAHERLLADLSYEWAPFTLEGQHLTFAQHCGARLASSRCSHWGAAVYKWEGALSSGPHTGKRGILIGETEDLRQRIKQYVAGTQDRGNRLWRESFLQLGDIRLWVLQLHGFCLTLGEHAVLVPAPELLASNNRRLVLEQLLVMRTLHEADRTTWIVNARQ